MAYLREYLAMPSNKYYCPVCETDYKVPCALHHMKGQARDISNIPEAEIIERKPLVRQVYEPEAPKDFLGRLFR